MKKYNIEMGNIKKIGSVIACTAVMAVFAANPAYADTVDTENLISDIKTPEPGVIQYDVTVPAGSTVNYSVELTPDKETGTIDKVEGMWKNTTKKAVTKTINAKVKFLSGEYTISATYTSNETAQTLEYKDKAEAVKSYGFSETRTRFTWDTNAVEKLQQALGKQFKLISEYIK